MAKDVDTDWHLGRSRRPTVNILGRYLLEQHRILLLRLAKSMDMSVLSGKVEKGGYLQPQLAVHTCTLARLESLLAFSTPPVLHHGRASALIENVAHLLDAAKEA